MEEDVVEIYVDRETGDLVIYIPASATAYECQIGDKEVELSDRHVFITQINFDEIRGIKPPSRYVAENVEESKISEDLKQRFKGKWVVYQLFAGKPVIFDYYDSEEEAKKEAELLNKAEKVVETIEEFAERILQTLTSEERSFLRRYTKGSIEIKI